MNEELVKIFKDLSVYESSRGRTYPSKSFLTVANSIQNLLFKVNSSNIDQIPNVGNSSRSVISEFLKYGESNRHKEAQRFISGLDELSQIKGIGAVKAAKLNACGIYSVSMLREITKNLNFGDKILNSDVNYIQAMQIGLEYEAHTDKTRMTVAQHDEIANPIMDDLRSMGYKVDVVGSRRRWDGKDQNYTIGDIDIIIASSDQTFYSSLEKYLDVVIMKGSTKVSGIKNRRQIDFRIIDEKYWGSMLLHGTGSAKFNIKLRCVALSKGMMLSEYGLVDQNTKEVIASESEEEIFEKLGVPYVAPWMRSIK